MPRRDGTGPKGQGPHTGKAAGPCPSADQPRVLRMGVGNCFHSGRGQKGCHCHGQPDAVNQNEDNQQQ